MQGQLRTEYPQYDIQILGINETPQAFANESVTEGRDLPWLQDIDSDRDGRSDVWAAWDVTWRDVVILDHDNHVVATLNLTDHDLADSEHFATLKNLFVQAAQSADATQANWQNPVTTMDVNGDQVVSPIDSLLILNELNSVGAHKLTGDGSGPPYVDTSGDGFVSTLDALLVLNDLNANALNANALNSNALNANAPVAAVSAGPERVPDRQIDLLFAIDDDDPYLSR